MDILVDTTVWSLALRRRLQHLNSREQLLVAGWAKLVRAVRAKIIGVVGQEILSGIGTNDQFKGIRKALSAFPDEPVDTADHEAAAKASNDCQAKGITASVVDILVCSVAKRRAMAIFTTGPDFERYARDFGLNLYRA
jgi:predicted nucleic acid-binding protein